MKTTRKNSAYFRALKYQLEKHNVYQEFCARLTTLQKTIFDMKIDKNSDKNSTIGKRLGTTAAAVGYNLSMTDQVAKDLISQSVSGEINVYEDSKEEIASSYTVDFTLLASALVASGEDVPDVSMNGYGKCFFVFPKNLAEKSEDFYSSKLMVDARKMAEAYQLLISKVNEAKGNVQGNYLQQPSSGL
jgi:hypothetical protein